MIRPRSTLMPRISAGMSRQLLPGASPVASLLTQGRMAAQTSSQAICAAILPWVNKLATGEASGNSWRDNPALMRGINVERGRIIHPALQHLAA